MSEKCPGQDRRTVKIETIVCPACGYAVEIFSDEARVACPRCKKKVARAQQPGCIQWCKASRQCRGYKGE